MGYDSSMTFRAVVQNGLIVVNTHGVLADGTTVEILVAREKRTRSAKKAKTVKAGAKKRSSGNSHTPGFGMWADRSDLGTPEQAVERLRSLTRRRRVG